MRLFRSHYCDRTVSTAASATTSSRYSISPSSSIPGTAGTAVPAGTAGGYRQVSTGIDRWRQERWHLRKVPQCGADIPVGAGLRGQAGMPAPHCHAPALRLAGTLLRQGYVGQAASPYLRLRASAEISPDTRPPSTPIDPINPHRPHQPPSELAIDDVDTSSLTAGTRTNATNHKSQI